nr:oxygen-binding protein [Cupriavidus basilensis]
MDPHHRAAPASPSPTSPTLPSSTSSPSGARWVPCTRACYLTLHWPVSEAQPGRREAPAGCLPVLPQPPHRLLAICEESGLRELVMHHMRRLRLTPLFARAGNCFECVASRVADFVVESCGGPLYYSQHHAHLQAGAGLPLLLDEEGRELWLVQLWHAFDDAGFPPALRADFWGWAEPLSVHLLAPQARHAGLTRYPYDTVRSWFPAPPPDARGEARPGRG